MRAAEEMRRRVGAGEGCTRPPLYRRLAGWAARDPLLAALLAAYLALVMATRGSALLFWRYLDIDAFLVIASLLLVSEGFRRSGLLSAAAEKLVAASRGSPGELLLLLTLLVYLAAPLVTNDAAVLVAAPLLAEISAAYSLDIDVATAVASIAANMGSVLTPIGNPQNAIIWVHYSIPFQTFVYTMLPLYTLSLALLAVYIAAVARGHPSLERRIPVEMRRVNTRLALASAAALASVVVLSERHLYAAALAAALTLFLVEPGLVASLDYRVFAAVFLLLLDPGVAASIISEHHLIGHLQGLEVYIDALLLSQVVSNVPATIILAPHTRDWLPLALGVNIGGVFLLTGSLANILAVRVTGARTGRFQALLLPYFAAICILAVVAYRLV